MNNNKCIELIFNHIEKHENSKLEFAISMCPNLNINKVKNKEGHTLLLHSINNNNIIGVNLLLKLGVSNRDSIYTFTAIENGNLNMLTLLKNNNFSLNKIDNNGNNLLHHYLISNINSYYNLKDNIIIFLLKENIELNSKNKNGFTPLDIIQSILKKEKQKEYQNINIIKLIETRIRMKMNINNHQNECVYNNLEGVINDSSSPIISNNYEDYKENSKKIYTSYYYPLDGETTNNKCSDFSNFIVEEEQLINNIQNIGIQQNNTIESKHNSKVSRSNNANGNSANAIGNSTNSNGNSANASGESANSKGTSANSKGTSANSKGASPNSNGNSANSNGNSANASGESANSEGTSANSKGASANTKNEYTNIFNNWIEEYKIKKTDAYKYNDVSYLYGCRCSEEGIKNGCEEHDVNWATINLNICDKILPYTKREEGFFKLKNDERNNELILNKITTNTNSGGPTIAATQRTVETTENATAATQRTVETTENATAAAAAEATVAAVGTDTTTTTTVISGFTNKISPFSNLKDKLASIRKGKENYENYLENQNNIQRDKNNTLILITIVVLVIILIIKLMNKA